MTGTWVMVSILIDGCVVVSGTLAFFWEISCRPGTPAVPMTAGIAITN